MRARAAVNRIATLCVGLGTLVPLAAHAAEDLRKREPTSWDVTLAPPGEPGDPFEMSGRLLSMTGEPLRNTKLFMYHADSKGRYTLRSDGPIHLAAVLRTDSLGRYRIRSVFPGSYGYPEHVHFEILDKPFGLGFVNVRKSGAGSPSSTNSVPVARAKDGVWRLHWDLRQGITGTNLQTPRVPVLRYPPLADSALR